MDKGRLFIVATPIGNLKDITLRAVEVLREVDHVVAEDTRHSRKLLDHLGISKSMLSLHQHNEAQRIDRLLTMLAEGEDVAMISDAGTPLIADPGARVVEAVRRSGFSVSPIPGPCAAITALSACGLPLDRFAFEGFLPSRDQSRRQALERVKQEPRTLVFYEAPHRILNSLEDLAQILGGQRNAVLARELTKTFETFLAGTLSELTAIVRDDPNQRRGEIVLMIAPEPARAATPDGGQTLTERIESSTVDLQALIGVLQDQMSAGKIASTLAKVTPFSRKQIYNSILGQSPDA